MCQLRDHATFFHDIKIRKKAAARKNVNSSQNVFVDRFEKRDKLHAGKIALKSNIFSWRFDLQKSAALENSVLYQLDRQTFNHIVRDSAIKRRERFETLLENIELLSTMDSYERIKIGDCLKTLKYRTGEVVVKEVPHPQLVCNWAQMLLRANREILETHFSSWKAELLLPEKATRKCMTTERTISLGNWPF